MYKSFGYPEFNASGEQILTTYNNEYSNMLMDIRVYKIKADEERIFCRPDYAQYSTIRRKFFLQ